ncbi:MAG: hypothetical protein CMI80_00805 [Candidatus Pelagibacter sp.]|nr:hypothetical protein [Candidatus Pelagibacter sp.]|tara:strand:- start:3115 stop:3579 length:465 start_codon:yes stop_codon:yes gene_type:complete
MSFSIKYHLNKILFLLFFILMSCQLQDPYNNHGILFLENRSNKLVPNETNQNDVLKIIGQPHTKSIDDENIWIYLERTLTKGKYHKLGKHIVKKNNVLVLNFDKYGILKSKELLDIKDSKKRAFSNDTTENQLSKKSFVENFLSSVRQKMYGNK